jgi:adenosine deaminase
MPSAWVTSVRRTLPAVACIVLVAIGATGVPAVAAPSSDQREQAVQQTLEHIARDAPRRTAFFQELPKGADLHQHLSGAVYAESMLAWAAEQGMCMAAATYATYAAPCAPGDLSAAATLTNTTAQSDIIAAWSMRLFRPSLTDSGHDHFFDAFGLFGGVFSTSTYTGKAVADVLRQADRDSVLHQETMLTPYTSTASSMSSALATALPGATQDAARFGEALAYLRQAGLDAAVAEAQHQTDIMLDQATADLACDAARQRLGCSVDLGLMAQANRNALPDRVFTQLAIDFALAQVDPRWVAVNLVAPEDGLLSLRDYTLQMRMVRYLHAQYPRAHVSLHAGELIPGLVPPEDLRSHVRQAVLIAGAERIGHGVDISQERDADGLLRAMRSRGVSVEVALTSNRQILEVTAHDSQFPVYRGAGVTVTLATDDPGLERTDLSEQYRMAHDWFDLDYSELKDLSYAALDEAFVSDGERRILRHELDADFLRFEKQWAR